MNNTVTKRVQGLSTRTLKIIAIIAMLIDHVAITMVHPGSTFYTAMRFAGRSAVPIILYFMVQDYHITKSVKHYTSRLAIFAVNSQIPFILAFYGELPNSNNFFDFNVVYTLLIGFLVVRARNEIKKPAIKVFAIILLFALALPGDWGIIIPITALAFDICRGSYLKQLGAYCLIALTVGGIIPLFAYPIYLATRGIFIGFYLYWGLLTVQLGLLMPILLLWRHKSEIIPDESKISTWGFYSFYPVHLFAIALANAILFI